MAYIERQNRDALLASPLGICPVSSVDELTYAILVLLKGFVNEREDRLVSALGAIENAKSEFQRTSVDIKNVQEQFDNGDV